MNPPGFLRSLISSPNGDDSYKRLCGLIMCVYVGVLILGDLFGHAPNPDIIALIRWVILATVGGATLDHLAPAPKKDGP